MAKALMGHVGIGPDLRLAASVRRLRDQVTTLESENDRLREDNQALREQLSALRNELLLTRELTLTGDVRLDEEILAPQPA